MAKITAEQLRAHDACDRALRRFNRMFPTGAIVNGANAKRAVKAFGLVASDFAAKILLTPKEEERSRRMWDFQCAHQRGYCAHMANVLKLAKTPGAKSYAALAKAGNK